MLMDCPFRPTLRSSDSYEMRRLRITRPFPPSVPSHGQRHTTLIFGFFSFTPVARLGMKFNLSDVLAERRVQSRAVAAIASKAKTTFN